MPSDIAQRGIRHVGRKWCKHIKWETTTYGWKTYYFHDGDDVMDATCWAICPKCSIINPTLSLSPKRDNDQRTPTKQK